MAVRKRLLFFNLSEKKRKSENRRRYFINKYLQSRKVFGNASILSLTLPHRGEFGNLKGKKDGLKQCGNTGIIMATKPTGELILECLDKALRS